MPADRDQGSFVSPLGDCVSPAAHPAGRPRATVRPKHCGRAAIAPHKGRPGGTRAIERRRLSNMAPRKTLVLSDIHSNIEALRAVIRGCP